MFVTVQTPDRDFKLSLNQLGGEILFSDAVNNAYWYGRNGNIAVWLLSLLDESKNQQRRALPVKWNKDQLRKTMWTVATQYLRPARNARLEVASAGVGIRADQSGRAINVGETCAALQTQYYVGKPEIKATTTSVAPKLAAADLIGRDVLMGKYTTSFNPIREGRTTNVRLATTAINGKVLMPGEKFSVQRHDRRTHDGQRLSRRARFVHLPGKEKAEVVDGRGGVCQVSSTLFNAVRKTNDKTNDHLAIVERNTHSLPVSYLPSGLDATVAWPDKDFRFRNTFPHPVYLRAEVSGSRLSISIWGRVLADTNSVTASADSETSESKTTKTSADSPDLKLILQAVATTVAALGVLPARRLALRAPAQYLHRSRLFQRRENRLI